MFINVHAATWLVAFTCFLAYLAPSPSSWWPFFFPSSFCLVLLPIPPPIYLLNQWEQHQIIGPVICFQNILPSWSRSARCFFSLWGLTHLQSPRDFPPYKCVNADSLITCHASQMFLMRSRSMNPKVAFTWNKQMLAR